MYLNVLAGKLHLFAVNLGASARCLEIVHSISTIRHSAQLFGTIAPYSAWRHPLFGIVHSILTDHPFNLDVSTLVGKVHTMSAKRKTISAESIQFRKCLIDFCKRFQSPRLPSLGRLLSRLPCVPPCAFPDRPNTQVRQTRDSVCNQRCFSNSGGQLQVVVGPGKRCLCSVWWLTAEAEGVPATHRRGAARHHRRPPGRWWLRWSCSSTSDKARDGLVDLGPLSAHRRGRLQAARRSSAPPAGRRE